MFKVVHSSFLDPLFLRWTVSRIAPASHRVSSCAVLALCSFKIYLLTFWPQCAWLWSCPPFPWFICKAIVATIHHVFSLTDPHAHLHLHLHRQHLDSLCCCQYPFVTIMSATLNLPSKRQHIQDHAAATSVRVHWGYASRVIPCVNDAGTCEYLDQVYWMHDVSMLYTFIMWAVIGALLALFIFLRIIKPQSRRQPRLSIGAAEQAESGESSFYRAWRGIQATLRRALLPESLVGWFGRVTRLQLLILAIISGYLLIFT